MRTKKTYGRKYGNNKNKKHNHKRKLKIKVNKVNNNNGCKCENVKRKPDWVDEYIIADGRKWVSYSCSNCNYYSIEP